MPEEYRGAIAAALGVEPDSPHLREVAGAFAFYLGVSADNERMRGLDSRQQKRVRESARGLSEALDACNDVTWLGLNFKLQRGEPGKREDWPNGLRLDDGTLLILGARGIQMEIERLERAATPPQGTPKMERERYLLLGLASIWERATGKRPTRTVDWHSDGHPESGPFWQFLEVCKKAYGLGHESWIGPLKYINKLLSGNKSARE